MKYKVTYSETEAHVIEIDADSKQDAIDRVENWLKGDGKETLRPTSDASCFYEWDITDIEKA